MRAYLAPLLFFQRFFLPSLALFLLWATWRTVLRKDLAVGLAFYLGLVIIVDGFLNTGLFIPGLEKGSIRYSEVCALFLLVGRAPAPPRQRPYAAVRAFVTLYFVLLLFSAFRSEPILSGISGFRMVMIPQIIAFLIAMRGLRSVDDFRRFFLCLTTLSLVVGLFVFWDLFFDRWLIKSDALFKPEYWVTRRSGRFGGFFLNPNFLGAFTVLTFPAAFMWTINEKGAWAKMFGAVGLLSLAFCLVETQSRGPMLAFGITILLLLLGPAGQMSRFRRLSVFVVFAAVFILLMPGFFEHASQRFETVDEEMSTESARTRETIWTYTKRAIADHPLMGIGFGEQQFVKVIMTDYDFEEQYGEASLDNPHNSYLQMTVYAGVPALLAFLFINAALLFQSGRCIARGRPAGQSHIAFGLAVGVAGFLAVIYPDMHMFTQTVASVYWVFVGLLLSLTTTITQPIAAENLYADRCAHIGGASQYLAGESTAFAPRDRRDRHRAETARPDRPREGRAAPAPGTALRDRPRDEQAVVQPGAVASALAERGVDDPGEFFPGRRAGRLCAAGTDDRRRQY